jgi:hypothetical protein
MRLLGLTPEQLRLESATRRAIALESRDLVINAVDEQD